METVLNILFYYVLIPITVLGIAVNIHEFGHFLVAKLFGMRVEAYSFFGLCPRVWGFKRGHTDYRISAIPLGAYVKLYGDEATAALEGGESQDEKVPERELYELRPRWQKFLVMLGGPFMNLMLALAVPFGMALIQGIPVATAPVLESVKLDGAAAKAGMKSGDRIVSFNGIESPTWQQVELQATINPDNALPVTIERAGQKFDLQVTPSRRNVLGQIVGDLEADPDPGVMPVVVGEVSPNTPAQEVGLLPGDRIVSIDGERVRSIPQSKDLVEANKANPIDLVIERNGQLQTLTASVRKLDDGTERLGFAFATPDLPVEKATLSSALTFAFDRNIENIQATASVLGQVFAGKRSVKDSGIGGPVGIFQQSAQITKAFGATGFFGVLGLISLSLGIFNLLPIPLLDGGQIMVLAVDKVMSWFGKTLSMVARERIQLTGLAIVLLLMVTVIFFDVSRLIGR